MYVLPVSLVIVAIALVIVGVNFVRVRRMAKSGSPLVLELAKIIRNGANLFMRREYYIIGPVLFGIAALYSLFVERWAGATLLIGGLMSSLACVLDMKAATYANVPTVETAREMYSLGRTQQTALLGGA